MWEQSLIDAHLDAAELIALIELALDEDLRYGPDVTSDATISIDQQCDAAVVTREPGVACGVPVALAVLHVVEFPESGITIEHHDGDEIAPGAVLLRLAGPLHPLLLAERTILNFMTHLSGIATATNTWVRALQGTSCEVRDTRKTTPGLRQLEKYAVRCGGGTNHRMGLGDAALVKDNHIEAAGGITRAVDAIRSVAPQISLEVECDTLDQVREALEVGCSLVLLDNMSIEMIDSAVALIRTFPGVRSEASGGMAIERARVVAETGVDYIAVGSLTHSVAALDIGLDVVSAN